MIETSIISFSRQKALAIHDEAMAVAKNIKSEYQKLFELLLIVEERKIYFELDIPSFHIYCKEMLQLSDSIAREFGIVVRKSLEVPQLANAIREGKISIYKARRISSVITEKNHKEWIDLAVECGSRIVERTVALANPREAAPESLTYVAGDVLNLKMGVSEEWAKLLERTKDLLSQQFHRAVSAEEALFYLMSEHCRKNDPLEKAKRAEVREAKREAKRNQKEVMKSQAARTTDSHLKEVAQDSVTTESHTTPTLDRVMSGEESNQPDTTSKRKCRYRPADVEHQVDLRDGCQCTYIDQNGKRCPSRRWLNKHHIVEFADGGEHTVENLTTLCWAHHKITHLKSSTQAPRPIWHVPNQASSEPKFP